MNYLFHLPRFRTTLCGLMLVLVACLIGLGASAQERTSIKASFEKDADRPIKVDVLVSQSRVIDFDQTIERVSVSDPKILDAIPISPKQVLINGLTFGQVNLVVWRKGAEVSATKAPEVPTEGAQTERADSSSKMIIFDIYVQANISLIDNQIKVLFPKENIQLSQAQGSIVLSGSVTNPEIAKQAQAIIEAAGFKDKVVNMLRSPVTDAVQVELQIRVAEVNRQVLRDISSAYGILNSALPVFISAAGPAAFAGYTVTNELLKDKDGVPIGTNRQQQLSTTPGAAVNLFLGHASNSSVTQGFIQALYSRGALRDLAEPRLIAMNGEEASFLAGGEFPIPIIQSATAGQNAITIQYKQFGVKLNFKPKIIDENHIQLVLEPEVSSLDRSSGVAIQGLIIPGLRVRRAKTTLELRDGQSFALAGLIDNSESVNLSKVPLLGDIPILGELFKSRSFQRNETELMFLVTVKLVEPLNPDQIPTLPGAADLKRGSIAPPSGGVEGQSGHAVQRKGGGPVAEPTASQTSTQQPEQTAKQTAKQPVETKPTEAKPAAGKPSESGPVKESGGVKQDKH